MSGMILGPDRLTAAHISARPNADPLLTGYPADTPGDLLAAAACWRRITAASCSSGWPAPGRTVRSPLRTTGDRGTPN